MAQSGNQGAGTQAPAESTLGGPRVAPPARTPKGAAGPPRGDVTALGATGSPEHGAWLRLPRLLTIDEAAAYMRITRGALYARIQRGNFPGLIKIGRHYRVDSARLLAWLDKSRVGNAPQGT